MVRNIGPCQRFLQAASATRGEGIYEGLDWLSRKLANLRRQLALQLAVSKRLVLQAMATASILQQNGLRSLSALLTA